MKKIDRELVYNKFDGRCAYSGTMLEDDWQVDHLVPKSLYERLYTLNVADMNNFENLMPTQSIINHYKHSLSLEEFRSWYLGGIHKRLLKLPKKPRTENSIKRKEYMLKVASYFGITPDKPFSGLFYFEKCELSDNGYESYRNSNWEFTQPLFG